MFSLASLKEKLSKGFNKVSGNKDFLEAVCAASALVAAADGSIDDEEIEAALNSIKSHPKLSGAFDTREIETCADAMLKRVESGGRVGKMSLYKEIKDIKADSEMKEMVYLVALDVADADGSIDKDERKVLNKIAADLSLNARDYDI